MGEWLRVACTKSVIRRGLKYGICVGALLIAINHGNALVHRDVTLARLLQMALTMTVPYMVSTASSVAALRDAMRADRNALDVPN